MAGAYEYLVGFTVFNTVGTGDPRSAGSIPVRLRHHPAGESPVASGDPGITHAFREAGLVEALGQRDRVFAGDAEALAQV